jgi:hypothetical protein
LIWREVRSGGRQRFDALAPPEELLGGTRRPQAIKHADYRILRRRVVDETRAGRDHRAAIVALRARRKIRLEPVIGNGLHGGEKYYHRRNPEHVHRCLQSLEKRYEGS